MQISQNIYIDDEKTYGAYLWLHSKFIPDCWAMACIICCFTWSSGSDIDNAAMSGVTAFVVAVTVLDMGGLIDTGILKEVWK